MASNRTISIVAATVLTILVILTIAAIALWQKSSATYARIEDIDTRFGKIQATLDEIHRDLAQSPAQVIDCTADPSTCAAEIPAKIASLRVSSTQRLAQLESLPLGADKARIERLGAKMNDFWHSLEAWNSLNIWNALRSGRPANVSRIPSSRPPIDALASLVTDVDSLSRDNLIHQQQSIHSVGDSYRSYLRAVALVGFFLIVVTAAVGLFRISQLQQIASREQTRAVKAEQELRALAQELLNVQEHERRKISRELHDEVGQILTGLRMELGSLTSLPPTNSQEFRERLDHAKALSEDAMRSIRDMAMLLRPPMLDDMGLEPALRWQARQFSARLGIPVTLDVQADVNTLPDRYTTCLYRIAQEALNNSAKHASASEIQIRLRDTENEIVLTVEDDGIGFNAQKNRSAGFGLISIEERARELSGRATVSPRENGGTRLEVELPLPATVVS